MAVFQGAEFDSLKERLKKEFPLKANEALHSQLHQALNDGSNICLYYVSKALRPDAPNTVPADKIKLYEDLYFDFMKFISSTYSDNPALASEDLNLA